MNVLIVGLGSIAEKHIKALKVIDYNVQLYALRSSNNAVEIPKIINIYNISHLANFKFDFAIISNPTNLHYETIRALIPFKIPLFIEKPVFDKIDDESILKEIKDNKIITYVACNLRFLDSLIFTKKFIVDKRINEVNSYCGSYLPDWRPNKDFRTIYSANKEMGGGVHIDLIHEIDYICWFFGMPKKVHDFKSSKSSLDISAFDYANYLFEYSSFSANITLNYYRRDSKRYLEIVTSDGTVYVDLLKNEVQFKNKIIFVSERTSLDTYEDQLTFFINNILQKKEKFNSINEAFQILKLCIQND